jgi:predicted acyltransferase
MEIKPEQRLLSLDTLRGFDMFWIAGGDRFFRTLADVTDWKWADWWGAQMHHVKWEGFVAYDLIFPLFMFISGVAIPFALTRKLEQGAARASLVFKVAKRALILVVLGMVYNGFLDFKFSDARVASVLGQIGLAYLIAALIVLYCRSVKGQLGWLLGILSVYAAIQLLVPVPGHGAGVLTPEACINGYIDRLLLPGSLYGTVFDPEGLLCIVSAAGMTLMGVLAGHVLRMDRFSGHHKTLILAGSGVTCILLGVFLGQWYPIIKAAWTTPFNLLVGGISLLLLAIFYLVIDVWRFQKWTFVLRVVGLNSITIYLTMRVVNFADMSTFFFGGIGTLCGAHGPLVMCAGVLALEWLLLWFLYQKRFFLRV